MLSSRSADVSDISATGVKLTGPDLPRAGQDLFVRIEGIEVFATVVWRDADECGVAFETPLDQAQLNALQCEARRMRLMRLTLEQKQAWEQWAVSAR